VGIGQRNIARIDRELTSGTHSDSDRIQALLRKASLFMYEGQAKEAYQVLQQVRAEVEPSRALAGRWLYTIIFFQGVAGLRRGEHENCLMCRGEGACIFPIRPTAIHTNPAGSRLAVQHFTEYLQQFPEDPGVRWLLNLAYMTLGEHPKQVPTSYL